jgi:hypothetical protein
MNSGEIEPSKQNLQHRVMTAIAARALTLQAAGHDHKVLSWWCQLAALMCGLAWRARGWHIQIQPEGGNGQAHWLVGLPAGSVEVRPLQALALAHVALDELANGRPVDAEGLQELTRALDGLDGSDPIVRAARALERVARDRGITLESVYTTTPQLLNAVEAMAAEFERSLPQPHPGDYIGPLTTMPIPAPNTPAPGEAKKVLEHLLEVSCHQLEIEKLFL